MNKLTKSLLTLCLVLLVVACLVACGDCKHAWQDGVCTKCNQVCSHTYVEGKCSICSAECHHSYVDSVCIKCNQACTHTYQNGMCTKCQKVCTTHNYQDGTCLVCGKVCATHNFVDSVCTICGKVCTPHSYVNGVCSTCQKVCSPHSYNEGVCTVCGKVCAHSYVNGVCSVCTFACKHSFVNGACTSCLFVCSHSYQEGMCTICNKVCSPHSYNEGVCAVCQIVCPHVSYDDGRCLNCGMACKHVYVEGTCTVCSMACTHDYKGGVCQDCGNVCNHSYQNSQCIHCDVACTSHVFAEGVCAICSFVCSHTYKDGVCSNCNYYCAHFYVSGVCNYCGKKDPSYIPPGSSLEKYLPIINCFKDLVEYKKATESLPPRGDNEPYYYDAVYTAVGYYDPTRDFGYTIDDVNGDGTDELLLMERRCNLYSLFTLVDDVPTHVASFQDGMGYLAPWGEVFYNEKLQEGTNYYNVKHVKKLVGSTLVGVEYLWVDTDGDLATDEDMQYFYSTNGSRQQITKDQYNVYSTQYGYYWDYPSRLTRLVGLQFVPALRTTMGSVPTADFSSYQATIETFRLMYVEVALKAGTKYERTKWTDGTYEQMMAFDSLADYKIYNKLMASCVLAQSTSSAKFGYALRDLNGDGVDELVLLQNEYCVLAIFTQHNGKVVLLDSYTDTRSAFIDGNGVIHVQARLLPGMHKKDASYTLYTIQEGKLVATLSVAVRHTKAGVADSWLNLLATGDQALSSEQFATLQAQWAGDLGSAAFDDYTKANAKLQFVQFDN
ncbi:MAG: hypothetical protein IKC47_02190 [Clostridia bacterium]|nr:hypothetical protein [Clostridia bacterium]